MIEIIVGTVIIAALIVIFKYFVKEDDIVSRIDHNPYNIKKKGKTKKVVQDGKVKIINKVDDDKNREISNADKNSMEKRRIRKT